MRALNWPRIFPSKRQIYERFYSRYYNHIIIFSVVGVVQWNEDLYERQLIERTIDACDGRVDIVIDFGTTSRSLHRSMQCLTADGWVLISAQVADRLQPKFSRLADELHVHIEPVEAGTVDQLHELVDLVASGQVRR